MVKLGFVQETSNRYQPVLVRMYDILGNPLDYTLLFTAEEVQEIMHLLQQAQPQKPQPEEAIVDEL